MRLLDEEHLLLAPVLVEDALDLLERDQLVALGGDEDARRGDEAGQGLEVHFVDVEVGLRKDYRLDVLVGDVEQQFGQVGPLLADLDEQLPQGLEGTVEDGHSDVLAVQRQEPEGFIIKQVPVTAPMDRPQRQNLAS